MTDIGERLLDFQRGEITEHRIYLSLAERLKSEENRRVLRRIADEELRHYGVWKRHTGRDVAPDRWKIRWYGFLARVAGFTFAVKLMERGEEGAEENYERLRDEVPEAEKIAEDENRHERELLALLDEERLRYTGSVVLGLNDALVELTGALAGFTLALRDTRLIALTGLITGVAAALSMASSEYLSRKAEGSEVSPGKAALYTGAAYIVTVGLLILPYLVLADYFACLGLTLGAAVFIIFCFNYYLSVARDLPFLRRFLEMAGISLGVAAASFGVGYLVRALLGVDA